MEKKFSRKPLAVALGTAFAATLGASSLASADTSPFTAQDLGAGYLLVADTGDGAAAAEPAPAADAAAPAADAAASKEGEGKCGEGKCGEGKCGADKKAEEKPAEGGAAQ
jgi:uncharacterized low-complexity protein